MANVIDGEEVDTTNRFLVGVMGDKITIMNPPRGPISKRDALVFAAWVATLADDSGMDFDTALHAVQG